MIGWALLLLLAEAWPSNHANKPPPAPATTPARPTGQPPLPWPRIGGHVGLAIPIFSVDNDGTTVIGRDFTQVGLSPGIAVKLDERWSLDLELIGYSRWQRNRDTPDVVRTLVLVDPGVVYSWGWFSTGVRLTVEVGDRQPLNYGIMPIVNKAFKFGKTNWYVELDLPFFINATPARTTVSFSAQVQTGVSF